MSPAGVFVRPFSPLRGRLDIEPVADHRPVAVHRKPAEASEELPGCAVLCERLRRQMGDAGGACVRDHAGQQQPGEPLAVPVIQHGEGQFRLPARSGWKVGLVGRNGTGKSTLLTLIREEVGKANASIRVRRGARMGFVAQEAPQVDTPLLELVMAADEEMTALLKEAETAEDPQRIADIHMRLAEIDGYSGEARASAIMIGLGFEQDDLTRAAREFSGGWRMRAALPACCSPPDLLSSTNRPTISILKAPRGLRNICANIRAHGDLRQPRSRNAQSLGDAHSGAGRQEARSLRRRLRRVSEEESRAHGARARG
jgi:predicted ABC-type transport system involved in lysophospholipase L1 biosynthesis ATPase subunit